MKNKELSINSSLDFNRRLSVAPMLDWTDRHARYFMRQLSAHTLLYSEMVVTNAILMGDAHHHLQYNTAEHPVALQLGGSDPKALAQCAQMGEEYGYDEINLNCGCPSDRVQSGGIGACLMGNANLVAECVAAMKAVVKIPVTVKTRLGIDHQDSWEFVQNFVQTVDAAGVDHWIIHARKAWLKGLSPKENREIPPLDYGAVYRLKSILPQRGFSLNGGVKTLDAVEQILVGTHAQTQDYAAVVPQEHPLQGVMLGRGIYENLWILHRADQQIFGAATPPRFATQKEYLLSLEPYLARQVELKVPLHLLTKHLLSLFIGVPGARRYRQIMGEQSCRTQDVKKLLATALAVLPENC